MKTQDLKMSQDIHKTQGNIMYVPYVDEMKLTGKSLSNHSTIQKEKKCLVEYFINDTFGIFHLFLSRDNNFFKKQ